MAWCAAGDVRECSCVLVRDRACVCVCVRACGVGAGARIARSSLWAGSAPPGLRSAGSSSWPSLVAYGASRGGCGERARTFAAGGAWQRVTHSHRLDAAAPAAPSVAAPAE